MKTEKREVVKRTIASILDGPSVYMGGPSTASLRRAENVVRYLEDEDLVEWEKI